MNPHQVDKAWNGEREQEMFWLDKKEEWQNKELVENTSKSTWLNKKNLSNKSSRKSKNIIEKSIVPTLSNNSSSNL